ncbi:MAG: hypothetical protein HQL24_08215 [Candidatus Omnitrophica bacterium]|nr:hypothetical protein [Candidatus Omnitrophota bacterium]
MLKKTTITVNEAMQKDAIFGHLDSKLKPISPLPIYEIKTKAKTIVAPVITKIKNAKREEIKTT